MHKLATVVCALFIIVAAWSANSFAASMGFAVDGSTGSGEAEWESDWDSWNVDTRGFGVGFVLDTGSMDDRVFNYRLNAGYGRQDIEDEENVTMKSDGIYFENTFAFAFVRQPDFRWWAGPLVRVGYYYGDSDNIRNAAETRRTEVEYGEFAAGGVTGWNFKSGGAIFSPSIGVRFTGFAGEGKTRIRTDAGDTFTHREDFDGFATNFFANFAVLF